MRIADMIVALASRAIAGAAVATLLDGVARLTVVTLLWGNPLGQHELFARLVGFAMASACVLSLGHALAVPMARAIATLAGKSQGPPVRALASIAAGVAGQALALLALHLIAGPAGQADLDLPLLRTPATLFFGAAVALGCGVARPAAEQDTRRAALGGALVGACALAICHAYFGEVPPGGPADPVVPGGLAGGLLAGLADGLAVGAGLGLASGWTRAPGPRMVRAARAALATVGLAVALSLGFWLHARSTVEQRLAELEPLVERVRAHPRASDPVFARWLSDVRTRQEKVVDSLHRFPWYFLRFQGSFAWPWRLVGRGGELTRMLDDSETILLALLGEPPRTEAAGTSALHLLRLVSTFRVPATLEYQEHFKRNVLAVFRGGVPLFAVSALGLSDPGRPALEGHIARGWTIRLPGGRTATAFKKGVRRCVLADGWIYDAWAPTEALRLRLIERLVTGRPLAPGDDLVDAAVLIPPGILPTAVRARADIAPDGAAMATARGWLKEGLRPFYGDVHTHASSTLGGSVPGPVAAANALSMFSHFHALTEHFSALGNEPVARYIAERAPGSTFIPGEEITVGLAHLTALGTTRWIPAPWHTFTAPPERFLERIAAQGALPVLAHAYYPLNAWQEDALGHWRERGLVAAELTTWMEDGIYEAAAAPPPALGGSDAHCGCFAGSARTLVLARDASPASILEAIRAGRSLSLRLDQPALSRGSPAMRAALWQLLEEPGRLERELAATWKGAAVASRPIFRDE